MEPGVQGKSEPLFFKENPKQPSKESELTLLLHGFLFMENIYASTELRFFKFHRSFTVCIKEILNLYCIVLLFLTL